MEHTEAEYLAILRDSLPKKFMGALLASVVTAHHAAFRHVRSTFDNAASRHNVLGHVRREKLHEEALSLGEKFKVKAEMKPYARGSGYYLLISSKQIFLIICVTPSRKTMVRPAEYKKILAQFNENTQQKFSWMPQDESGNQFLCILIHGRRRGKNYPAFADIAFPHKSFERWMCRLNLFSEFPEIVDKLIIRPDMEARPQHSRGLKRRSA
jgi:hypothetical protein